VFELRILHDLSDLRSFSRACLLPALERMAREASDTASACESASAHESGGNLPRTPPVRADLLSPVLVGVLCMYNVRRGFRLALFREWVSAR
jgi:hypothetical protein